jgi:hypothetical protein
MTEWQDDDTFETTYGTLRKAMAEAQEAERERILEFLKNWTVRGDDDYAIGYRDALSAVIGQVVWQGTQPQGRQPSDV